MTLKTKPGKVSELKSGDRTTKDSIHIKWDPPDNGGEELVDYKVYWAKHQ